MAALSTSAVTQNYHLTGLTCADCAAKLEQKLRAIEGIDEVSLNFMAAKLTVRHRLTPAQVMRAVEDAGYGATQDRQPAAPAHASFLRTHHRLLTTATSGALLLLAWALSLVQSPAYITLPLFLAAILIGGYWTFRRGLVSLRSGSFDMNALMTIAVVGAGIIGEWTEAATVAFLFSLSNLLESYTMEKTRQSIRGLMDLAPREALVRRDGVEIRLPVEQVQVGDIVIIKPGEKIAVDGTVVSGHSSANQAAITGESLPVEKAPGDEVFAGTLNMQGALEVNVTRLAEDTALAHIIHLVEEAQAKRAPSQAFVDRFARYYTPAVLVTAVLIAIVPPLLFAQAWHPWFYRALALIVVACPCALVISTPVAIVSAIGNAARHGVLIKGGAYLEQAGRLAAIAFDKTGTLTQGRPVVTDVIPAQGVDTRTLLAIAAAVEDRSSHPLADAVLHRAQGEDITLPDAESAVSLPGRGAQAVVDGVPAYVGNRRFFNELGIDAGALGQTIDALEHQGKTTMLVAHGANVLGVLAAADQLRQQSHHTIEELREAGIRRVVMLTGDHQGTAQRIAERVGVDDVRADLLPADKASAVHDLQAQIGPVGMVGDGVNDAPALATAAVGIAMGAAGTDTALETADIALMSDDLKKLPYTIRLSRRTLSVIKQNIALSIAIKALAVALIFPGWLTLWMAVLADMGASILVTLNGLRLVRDERRAACHDDQCGGGGCCG